MAQKAEEYGSHDKTFEMAAPGTMRVVDSRSQQNIGNPLLLLPLTTLLLLAHLPAPAAHLAKTPCYKPDASECLQRQGVDGA